MPYSINNEQGVRYLSCNLLAGYDFLLHAFSTRQGGVSLGPYSSLNLSPDVGDEAQNVAKNRQLFCQALGIDVEQVFSLNQVHGNRVLLVDEQLLAMWRKGQLKQPISADAVLTDQPGVALTVLTADCLPIIIVNPKMQAIALVHAGWRGTCRGVTQKTLSKLIECFGGLAADFFVSMGPCIGSCCYEVSSDVVDVFREKFSDWHKYCSRKGATWGLDLVGANCAQLIGAGVLPQNISQVDCCTACHPDMFFSYRKSAGKTGRMLSLVTLKQANHKKN